MSDLPDIFDVLIVGAGPAGIAAAVTAAEAGRSVCIVDEGAFAGGQIWRNRGEQQGNAQARQWLQRLAAIEKNITWLKQARVVARPSSRELLIELPDGARIVGWKSLILATGARELFLPLPGWTLPGVVGAGGIQALVKQGLNVRGKRVVVAGTGPLLLAVAALLRSKGAIVPLILEQAPSNRITRFALSLVRTPAKLIAGVGLRSKLLGTKYATGSYATYIAQAATGLRVSYRNERVNGAVECDFFACGFNLIPNTELPQLMGCKTTGSGFVRVDHNLLTTAPGVFAVGELTGIGGVEKALVEGQIAGHIASGNTSQAAKLAPARSAAIQFANNLDKAFALRPEVLQLAEPQTIVCRCEDVPLSAVEKTISGRDAKLQTRCGMGPCQGRVCGPILQRLCHAEPPRVRPPVLATKIGTLIAAGKDDQA